MDSGSCEHKSSLFFYCPGNTWRLETWPLCDNTAVWPTYLSRTLFRRSLPRCVGTKCQVRQCVCESWGDKSSSLNGKWEWLFILHFLVLYLFPAFRSEYRYLWTDVFCLDLKPNSTKTKTQGESQETGSKEGRLKTLQLQSQNCQLETYRMTLKFPTLSQCPKYSSRFA